MSPSRWGLFIIVSAILALIYLLPLHFKALPEAHSDQSKLPAPTDMPIPGMPGQPPAPVNNLQQVPAPTTAPTPNLEAQARVSELPPEIELGDETFKYDPSGKRDPFRSFLNTAVQETSGPIQDVKATLTRDKLFPNQEAQTFDNRSETLTNLETDQLNLIGVLWEVKDPKAMLRSPTGKVFTVRHQTRVGKKSGYVGAIREGEIVVIEMSQDGRRPVSKVLTIAK
jgi:type IV pilus assembly protein PilP